MNSSWGILSFVVNIGWLSEIVVEVVEIRDEILKEKIRFEFVESSEKTTNHERRSYVGDVFIPGKENLFVIR